jgi:hypothetical protein
MVTTSHTIINHIVVVAVGYIRVNFIIIINYIVIITEDTIKEVGYTTKEEVDTIKEVGYTAMVIVRG